MGLTEAFEEAAAERIVLCSDGETGSLREFSCREPTSCVLEEVGRVRGQGQISSGFATVFKIGEFLKESRKRERGGSPASLWNRALRRE